MDELQRRFAEGVWQREPELLGDLPRLKALLSDYLPDRAYRAKRRAILIAVECKVADSIQACSAQMLSILRSREIAKLKTEGLEDEAAAWAVDALALVVGPAFDPEACFQMGSRLAPERLLAQLETTEADDANFSRAACCFKRSASAGHGDACLWLGEMSRLGKGLHCDPDEGTRWLLQGADLGSAEAQYALGRAYRFGIGIEESIVKSIEWLHKAAEKGVAGAQWELGQIYRWPSYGRQDIPQALILMQEAAVQGHWMAAQELGELHHRQGKNSDAILWYTRAALSGSSDIAFSRLGDLLVSETPPNFPAAFRWYSEGAKRREIVCMTRLAQMYEKGQGFGRDTNKALKLWHLLTEEPLFAAKAKFNVLRIEAEGGDPTAQVNLGITYENGEHLDGEWFSDGNEASEPDLTLAVHWYRKAAEAGDADGQWNLGEMYENGKGVKADKEAAMKWYRAAAAQGNLDSQKKLGELFAEGRSAFEDSVEALKWYAPAAKQGDANAQFITGLLFERHDSLEGYEEFKRDSGDWDWLEGERGAVLYWAAALQGHEEAASRLAEVIDEHGFTTGEQYIEETIKGYRLSPEQGHAHGQLKLGDLYRFGKGLEEDNEDIDEAVKWYRAAAAQGHLDSQKKLAELFYEGESVSKDYEESLKWYLLAAKQGDAYAQYSAGWLYEHDDSLEGYEEFESEASEWNWLEGERGAVFYWKAALQGHAEAAYRLAKLIEELGFNTGELYIEDQIRWFEVAASNGHVMAALEAASLLEGSRLDDEEPDEKQEANERRAFQWVLMAAEKGNEEAQLRLSRMYEASSLSDPVQSIGSEKPPNRGSKQRS